MEYHLVELSKLHDDEIKRLAILHHAVMHTLLSDLGPPFVWRYYQIARKEPKTIGFCAMADSGEVLGWAMGSPHPDRITSQLRSPLPWFMVQMLRITLFRPFLLWQLISSVRTKQAEMHDKSIELTYIGVASGQRRHGLGKNLLDAFIKESHSQGYRSVVLSVEQENSSAVSLYEKAGFKIIHTFTEGRFQRHRMELTLA